MDHHLSALLDIHAWTPCSSDEDLRHLYRHISMNYDAIKHYGQQAAMEAEAAKVYILPLLKGHAAHKITELKVKNVDYNIPSILAKLKRIIGHSKFLESSQSLHQDSRRNSRPRRVNVVHRDQEDTDSEEEPEISCNAVHSSSSNRGDRKVTWEDRQPERKRYESPSPDRSRSRYQTPPRRPSPVQFNCPFCETNDHSDNECKKYDNRDAYWQHVMRKRWCSNCLRSGHRWRDCFKESKCALSCDRVDKHVSVLCDKYYKK